MLPIEWRVCGLQLLAMVTDSDLIEALSLALRVDHSALTPVSQIKVLPH